MTRTRRHLSIVAITLLLMHGVISAQQEMASRPASIADALSIHRFQVNDVDSQAAYRWATFSPDGSRFAVVVSQANPERDVNVHSLLLFEESNLAAPVTTENMRPLVSFDFVGDPEEQFLSPISKVSIQSDNRTIAFLGRASGQSPQLYTVDAVTRELKQLSHLDVPVNDYVLGSDGQPRILAVARERLDTDLADGRVRSGLFPLTSQSLSEGGLGGYAVDSHRPKRIKEYLFLPTQKSLIDVPDGIDSDEEELSNISTLVGDPTGNYALVFPFNTSRNRSSIGQYVQYALSSERERRLSTPYGLINLTNGVTEPLIDAPHPVTDDELVGSSPIWSPSGDAVLIRTLLPLSGTDKLRNVLLVAQWYEINIKTRQPKEIPVPAGWHPVLWESRSNSIIIAKGNEFASIAKSQDGLWQSPTPIGTLEQLPSLHVIYQPATNGRIVVGPIEAPTKPTELAAYDITKRSLTVLTDLNGHLRQVVHAPAEVIEWKGTLAGKSTGYLFRPLKASPEARTPLVILLDDGVISYGDPPYMMDGGFLHLNAHPVQALAAAGISVLYTKEPTVALRNAIDTPREGNVIVDFIESAVRRLDEAGIVDPSRVGIAGWSRAGYYTHYAIIHSQLKLAAAVSVDGGCREYNDRSRPFSDMELDAIRTPLLVQAHGPSSLIIHGALVDRLVALRKPVEVLYLPNASHSAERPSDRAASLGVTYDWFRFWLQGIEDTDASKAKQYERWRVLRK